MKTVDRTTRQWGLAFRPSVASGPDRTFATDNQTGAALGSAIAVFVIPIYALILCYPFFTTLAASLSGRGWWDGKWAVLATLIVCADGAWGTLVGPERKRRFFAWLVSLMAIAVLGTLDLPEALFLAGLCVIFAVLRVVTSYRRARDFPQAVTVGAVGFVLAVFLGSISLWMAVTAFLLVSWLDGLKSGEPTILTPPDRFRDSERLARGILSRSGL